jgi:hypothetical protein
MEKKKNTVYEAPEVNVITLEQESVICSCSRNDYEYGGLDEPDNARNFIVLIYETE